MIWAATTLRKRTMELMTMSGNRLQINSPKWIMSPKVDDLAEASKSIMTLQAMVDRDIESNCVRAGGSHTRNLLRVKRGLDMVRVLFEQIIATKDLAKTPMQIYVGASAAVILYTDKLFPSKELGMD